MGGVAGHMDHLYENRDLTFGEMKEILEGILKVENLSKNTYEIVSKNLNST